MSRLYRFIAIASYFSPIPAASSRLFDTHTRHTWLWRSRAWFYLVRFHLYRCRCRCAHARSQFAVYRFTLMGVLFRNACRAFKLNLNGHTLLLLSPPTSSSSSPSSLPRRFMLYLDGERCKRFLYFDWIIYSNSFYYLTYVPRRSSRTNIDTHTHITSGSCMKSACTRSPYYCALLNRLRGKICVAKRNRVHGNVSDAKCYRRRWLKGAYMNLCAIRCLHRIWCAHFAQSRN